MLMSHINRLALRIPKVLNRSSDRKTSHLFCCWRVNCCHGPNLTPTRSLSPSWAKKRKEKKRKNLLWQSFTSRSIFVAVAGSQGQSLTEVEGRISRENKGACRVEQLDFVVLLRAGASRRSASLRLPGLWNPTLPLSPRTHVEKSECITKKKKTLLQTNRKSFWLLPCSYIVRYIRLLLAVILTCFLY